MTFEKYKEELTTLTTFVTHYCGDKHKDLPKKIRSISVSYADERCDPLEAVLCAECTNIIAYGITRLQKCPYEEKPKCRKCVDPCYDRPQWKHVASIMSYSGMKLGLTKIKNKIRFWSAS
jgi:hypothetical protein